jgi:pimeloyl-ACP methyl ester carboxylesterase
MRVPLPVRALPALTFQAWLTPPPLPRSTAASDAAALADLSPVYFGGVAGYELGTGPVAIAIHGWGGRPAQMAPLARRLADHGYRVLIPRLPGHAGGAGTDIKKVAAALGAVIADVGYPELIVGHSFAAMVMRLAFSDFAPHRVVLVSPALNVTDALDVFGDRLRLFPWARRGLRRRLEAWDPSLWPKMSTLFAGQLPKAEVLILHDPDDADTPFARSAELAALRPGTSIVAMDNTGHSRILSDEGTLEAVARFASAEPVAHHNVA